MVVMKFDKLSPEELEKAANMLKAIAHPMRIAILNYLDDGKKQEKGPELNHCLIRLHNRLLCYQSKIRIY